MKKTEVLSLSQQELVEENLDVVRWAIYIHIQVNETIFGFSYDDLFQEGCICLCKAATTYNGKKAKFETYAKVVVKNGLLNYCRKVYSKHQRQLSLQALTFPDDKDDTTFLDFLAADDFSDTTISLMTTLGLLESVKKNYRGVARLGIEALELKIKGLSGWDIARLYGVAPNHVGAWISRATKKLRKDDRFIMGLREIVVEKIPPETV